MTKADQDFNESYFADYDLSRKVTLLVDDELTHFAQYYLVGDTAKEILPIGHWRISWSGTVKTKEGEKKEARFEVRYDLNGKLIGLEQVFPQTTTLHNLDETEALAKARVFLTYFDIDTSSIELTRKRIDKEDKTLIHEFTFTLPSSISPNLKRSLEVTISGTKLTYYRAKTSLDKRKFEFPKEENVSETIAYVLLLLVWAAISIFLVVIFLKRLRHDELEFKRAIWLGIFAFIVVWIIVGMATWPEWEGVLVGGGVAGFFTGLAILIVYSVTESLNRDIWPQKLALTDLLFRGLLRTKEMGLALLNTIFIAGLALFFFGLLSWLTSNANLGYIAVQDDSLWIFQSSYAIVSTIAENLTVALFVGFILFSFWPAYLRSKIQNTGILIISLALFIDFSGLHLMYLRPTYLSFFLMLPFAIYLAYVIFKYDLFTVLLSLFTFYYFLDLSLVSLLPDGFLSTPGVVSALFVIFMLTVGLYLSYSKVSVRDFEKYVPEYVSRIAERERLLKELEIARSVQMRFLPQSVPTFPNLEIASICRPAMEVGGDYYDFIRDGNQCLSIVIGDVSGKGVSAAFYMTMAKGIIKTLSKSKKSPKGLLTEMNAIFYENAPRDVFISVIYGQFNMKDKMLTFARAGHNPLIVRKSVIGQPELLNPKGIAIGLESGQLFSTTIEEKSLSIEPEDVFVFYTDGICESMNKKGEEFGEERLQQIISRNAHHSAQTILDKITEEINKFARNTTPHDDFTMVVVKVGL
ncbi:MAG: PP2C family protein-serine/threonine phosphatase [bacterium]